jgi:cytoskeletal protein RodZ
MRERRSATRVRLAAFIFVVGLVLVFWFFFLRFSDEPNGGPASAEPSITNSQQSPALTP